MGVAEQIVPVLAFHDEFKLVAGIATGIESADESADAGAHHQVDGYVGFLEILYHGDVCGAFGTSATKDQCHCGTFLAYAVHVLAERHHRHRVTMQVDTETVALAGDFEGKENQEYI